MITIWIQMVAAQHRRYQKRSSCNSCVSRSSLPPGWLAGIHVPSLILSHYGRTIALHVCNCRWKKQRGADKDRSEEIKHIRKLWKVADMDRSGTLDAGELRKVKQHKKTHSRSVIDVLILLCCAVYIHQVFEWLGFRMNAKAFDQLMHKLDKDGDGDISQYEFIGWWSKLDKETRADALGTKIHGHDTHHRMFY